MKYHFFIIFTLIALPMSSQVQQTFLYEITLYEQFQHKSMWTEREHKIQQAHLAYLDSLSQNGQLQMAGIVDQGLEGHTGLVILTTKDYARAREIVLQDPSVKQGMMQARLRPINVYFE